METNTQNEQKVIVITGATSGLGFAAARALTGHGHFVIGLGRDEKRANYAERTIMLTYPDACIQYLMVDLSSQRQVKRCVHDIYKLLDSKNIDRVDVLINNAAAVSTWFKSTEDGYEMQFAVNHLAPFLLTHELLPALSRSGSGRVITVSSGSHRNTRMHWSDVMFRRGYQTLRAYKQSKLANVLFTHEFNRHKEASGVQAFAVDPGLVNTEIGLKGTSGIVRWVWERRRKGGISPEEGAKTMIYLAEAEEADITKGYYWKNCRPKPPSRYSQRENEAKKLWLLSARLCGTSG